MSRVLDEGQTVFERIVTFKFCLNEFSIPDEAGSRFSKEFVKQSNILVKINKYHANLARRHILK